MKAQKPSKKKTAMLPKWIAKMCFFVFAGVAVRNPTALLCYKDGV